MRTVLGTDVVKNVTEIRHRKEQRMCRCSLGQTAAKKQQFCERRFLKMKSHQEVLSVPRMRSLISVESVELLAGHRRELYLFPLCRILYNSCPINVSGPHDEGGDEKFSQNAPEND